MTNACLALLSIVAMSCTSSAEDLTDDCGTGACSKLSIRWTVESAGASSTCAAVNGATVNVLATFQADGRTAHITGACSNGALLSELLPLGPYRLDILLEDSAGTSLSTQTTTATLAAASVINEANVVFDVMSKVSPGHAFGRCAAGMSCVDAMNICVSDGLSAGYCSPPCTPGCPEVDPFLPPGSHAQTLCVPFSGAPDSPSVCVIRCGTTADCVPGLVCDPSNQRCQ